MTVWRSVSVVGELAAGGFRTLEGGVEGESEVDVSPASPVSSSSYNLSSEPETKTPPPTFALCGDFAVGVVVWSFTVGFGEWKELKRQKNFEEPVLVLGLGIKLDQVLMH